VQREREVVATITIDFKEDWEGRMTRTFGLTAAIAAIVLSTIGSVSAAEKNMDPGVTDTEIKVGQTVPIVARRQPFRVTAG